MNREITVLESEVIPGLDRARATIERILTATTQAARDDEHALGQVADSLEPMARDAVSTPDAAIAARLGNSAGSGAPMRHVRRDVHASWAEIVALVRELHGRTVDELNQSKRRLEILKDRERARDGSGGAST